MASFKETLKEITQRLVKEFSPERIFLFGSYAWGSPHKDSDLDLLVIVGTSEVSPAKRAARAYRCLRDIPYPLDIIVKTRHEIERFSQVPVSLEHKVLHQGTLLYG
jgi:predicted nucleotidyltransferase